ncbi:MAG: hypothetical protein AB7D46_09780 [Flavobacteriaceae bacterium]
MSLEKMLELEANVIIFWYLNKNSNSLISIDLLARCSTNLY